jgi:hypothetical protein
MLLILKCLLTRIALAYIVLSQECSAAHVTTPCLEKRQFKVVGNDTDLHQTPPRYTGELVVVGESRSVFGGGLSLCNRGVSTVHVALSLAGPVYYHNFLQPGQCRDWNGVGNVWFSVLGRTGFGRGFTSVDVVCPLLFVVSLVVGAVACMKVVRLHTQSGSSVSAAVGEGVRSGCQRFIKWPILVKFLFVLLACICCLLWSRDSVIASGVFAKCKRWDIIGGEVVWSINGTESSQFYPLELVNERDYACD